MSLLIVDDSRVAQYHLRAQLAAAGYDVVVVVDSGEAALQLLSPHDAPAVELVLLDVLMPGLDGVETCRRLKQLERLRDVPVIMVTAETETSLLKSAFEAGAIDYITKPADDVELIARVGSALKLHAETEARKARERELDHQRRVLEAELARAAQVQADLLPREAPALPSYELFARCLPAREVGGDFYDWQPAAGGGVAITVGDVMGKGMPAALLMATVRAALRPVAPNASPADAVAAAGGALEDDFTRSSTFVTLFHARLDPPTGRVDYVDAGHGYAFVHRAGGAVETLGPRGLPLGVQPGERYAQGSVTLAAGETLVVYSDGLVDTRGGRALDDAAITHLIGDRTTAAETVGRLLASTPRDAPPEDDMTVLALHRRAA